MKIPYKGNSGGRNYYQQSKFKKGKNTCLVCGQVEDWHCRVTEDEGLALCSYTPSDKKDSNGRYIHILKKNTDLYKLILEKAESENVNSTINAVNTTSNAVNAGQTLKADADRLNAVYTALLDDLYLDSAHADNLTEERGLSETAIVNNLYASVPEYQQRYKIAQKLSESFNLEGIPGFYLDGQRWCLNMTFSGFYIPYRDEEDRIVGLQIRRDEDIGDKYMWLSSAGKEKGVSSGTPLHFVNPALIREGKVVFITEGALKADIIGGGNELGVVASAGVSVINPQDLVNSIFRVFPDLKRVVIAYDIDWETNVNVRRGLLSLVDALKERFVKVEVATWDRSLGKGLDDVWANKDIKDDVIEYFSANEFLDIFLTDNAENVIEEDFFIKTSQNEFEQNELAETSMIVNEVTRVKSDSLGFSWREFSAIKFPSSERVIFGLGRGSLGLMIASTNIGKTTLILNLALSVASNRDFYPLLTEHHKAKRVLYIDGEATQAELQADLITMTKVFSPQENESVKDNLHIICDAEMTDGEPLDLVISQHLEAVKSEALAFNPDLIIVDTMSALMNVEDENDNALVKKHIIQPLKQLAKQTNSAILLLHHTGKYNEGLSPTGAYKGRGASTFGALSRVVFNMEKGKHKENRIVLSSPKVKGEKFPDTTLDLNINSRWFQVVNNAPTQDKPISNYEQVIDFVRKAGEPVKREVIESGLKISTSTLTRLLNQAVDDGDLIYPKYGFYSVPDYQEPNQEMPIAE